MKKKDVKVAEARSPAAKVDEQPLLRALVARAAVQGDTLVMLAKQLGVTYERLAQLRRSPGAISNVHQSVLMNAASYLGVPPILAFVMSRRIDLQHLAWPSALPRQWLYLKLPILRTPSMQRIPVPSPILIFPQ